MLFSRLLIALALFATPFTSALNGGETVRYSSPAAPWPESFGNHRAVIEVPRAAAVRLNFLWRRHDRNPEARRLLIVSSVSGDTVKNIHRLTVNNERCDIVFGPVRKAGAYHFYYLPYEVQEGWGWYQKEYLKPEDPPDPEWVGKNALAGAPERLPPARCVMIQSRTPFDSFFPMEVVPTTEEKREFLDLHPARYLVFPEDRANPIRMEDEIPAKWLAAAPGEQFSGTAKRNEYYAFQAGVYAVTGDLRNIAVSFSPLEDQAGHTIPLSAVTCFNTAGVDPYGVPFTKRVDVQKGRVQPLWMGIDVPKDASPGAYRGTVTISADSESARVIPLLLTVQDSLLDGRGDSEPWRHSRLRWLNSTLGIDDHPVAAYTPLQLRSATTVACLGRTIALGPLALPRSILAWGNELLSRPISLVVEVAGREERFTPSGLRMKLLSDGVLLASVEASGKDLAFSGEATLEADGYVHYRYTFSARKDVRLDDVRLEIPFRGEVAQLMMGMGRPGSAVPDSFRTGWGGPHDSYWVGSARGGLYCELRGASYCGPLLNLYRPAPPDSWHNSGKGGFRISRDGRQVLASAFSGPRVLGGGDSLRFEFALLVTPVKEVNTGSHFTGRYYHGGNVLPSPEECAAGVSVVNIHHANQYNPYINYPFLSVNELRGAVDSMHAAGVKVKLYYTIRELTNHVVEFWALRSLGDEILAGGGGGGFMWLREHVLDNYHPQWYQHFSDRASDASVLTSVAASRWYNYYVEGLGWLVKNVDVDGLYLDDVAYDRRILKRMRKVMELYKKGCLIDLHSNTLFSIGPATQYAEFFPYVDKIWFGEGFRYNSMSPDNWLVEVSGIPFGLMGDMLQDGGNRWLGMVYGMTMRLPWYSPGDKADPRPVWRLWDRFGIADARMAGYWEPSCPVRTNNPDVRATVYQKPGKALIALGSWASQPLRVKLQIDWKKLGLDPSDATLLAPPVADYQPAAEFAPGDEIPLEPLKGWLLILTKKGVFP